ncbi:MAG TPA: tetratricopeptide repeat protein [Pirellulales bacterium]
MLRSPWNRGWTALAVGASLSLASLGDARWALAQGVPTPAGSAPVGEAPAASANPATVAANTLIAKDAYALTRKPNVTAADLEKILELCQQGIDSGASPKMKTYGESLMSWAINRRGQNLLDAGHADAALADFEKAVELDPARHLAYHNRGYVRASRGEFDGALADFAKTVELNPTFVKGWINKGELNYALGNWDQAIADYSQALKLNPRQPDVQNQRGHAYYKAGKRQLALRDFSAAIALDDALVSAYINRGDLYSDVGYFERASNDYRKAVAINGSSHRALVSAAWLMATCGDEKYRDPATAIEAATKALQLLPKADPFRHRYLDVLAAAQANAGKFAEAEKTEGEAIAAAPEEVKPAYEQRLALYQEQKPYRDVVKPDSGVDADEQAAKQ